MQLRWRHDFFGSRLCERRPGAMGGVGPPLAAAAADSKLQAVAAERLRAAEVIADA